MKFQISPFMGAGELRLGMTPDQVRSVLGVEYRSFKRTPSTTYPHDYFTSLGVFAYYKAPGLLEAIEFTAPAEPIYKGKNLLNLPYVDLTRFLQSDDQDLEIKVDVLTSYRLGIGAWCPDAADDPSQPAETIIIFEKGYYRSFGDTMS